jgi:signal transduction histidine kinase/CheY-like chemotaxis protein
MSLGMLTVQLTYEHDIVLVRQRTRQISKLLGFDQQDQTRIATAVSEIARNAYNYGGGGKAEFQLEGRTSPQLLVIRVLDEGPGIANIEQILEGRYRSQTGMGLGIVGARRLVDQFRMEARPNGGTVVWLKKLLPRRAALVTPQKLAEIATQLANERPQDPWVEIQQQNQELLRTLDELRKRQDELTRLNDELEDTNRGVVALYAELDEKADHLRRADELKSHFLSNMSHEFRTPVNSIIAISRLLLDRMDGDLTPEQEKQVRFISKGAEDLSTHVNDLLDLAKVEAGKIDIHPTQFQVEELFGALRGMLKPLLVSDKVSLIFEEPFDIPPLNTDEAKVSQILRNFISNALKFTEDGEVRVSVTMDSTDVVLFSVADTGIGIAPEQQEFIFQEFTQVQNSLQKRVRGTGLGLPLTKKLAGLLGGTVSVESELGKGSTFFAKIPLAYSAPVPIEEVAEATSQVDPQRSPVLVVEDSAEALMLYDKFLKGSGFQVVPASTVHNARQIVQRLRPEAIILDIQLRGEDGWSFLARMKQEEATREIPIIVITNIEDQVKAVGLGADAYCIKPVERRWLLEKLNQFTRDARARRILLVDDEEATRYWLRGLLADLGCQVLETSHGLDAIRLAREQQPQTILLDLMMPVIGGEEVLEQLKTNPMTEHIPVIILTSKALQSEEQRSLATKAVAVLSKSILARREGRDLLREALQKAGWDLFALTARDSR